VVFNKLVDPGVALQPGTSSSSLFGSPSFTVDLGDDLRTVTLAPLKAWPKGDTERISLKYQDTTGTNMYASADVSFAVSFDRVTTPLPAPVVSPPDGSTNMPLNARVIVAFDRAVSASPGHVHLVDSRGNSVDLVPVYPYDASLLILAPSSPLQPSTTYQLT